MFRPARLLTALLAFTLLAANSASAITTASVEKPGSGLLGVLEHRAGVDTLASSDRVDEKLLLLYDFASDFPVAARGESVSFRVVSIRVLRTNRRHKRHRGRSPLDSDAAGSNVDAS
jgi:hypothetical protein